MCDEAGIFNCTSLAIGYIYVWLCSRMVTYGYTYGYVIKGTILTLNICKLRKTIYQKYCNSNTFVIVK